jgi:hypothetical protein
MLPKSLITMSCGIFLFGFFPGPALRRNNSDAFVATATYAAVLVVLVGAETGFG